MDNLLCRIGLHRWSKWWVSRRKENVFVPCGMCHGSYVTETDEYRTCAKCGAGQSRTMCYEKGRGPRG